MSVGSVTARIARQVSENENVGYSQYRRRSWFAAADWAGHVPSAQDADCSSLACGAIDYGLHDTYGVPWGHQALLEINDFWTGNMRAGMEARGFRERTWPDENLCPDGGFQAGDIILSAGNEGGTGHVVIALEDAADPLISESWISETGDIDGEPGDQTGEETRLKRYSAHPLTQRGAWTSCHRFDETLFFQQWPEFAGGKPATVPAPAAPAAQASPYTGKWNRSDGQGELVCNGIFGPATIGRLQQVMGTPVDGALDEDGSPAIERLQAFLNSVVPADTQVALNDAPALDVDGVLGPDTWRTLQYLIIAWHREYLPDGWEYSDWVDGEAGPATIGALQRALNNSRSNSGRLW